MELAICSLFRWICFYFLLLIACDSLWEYRYCGAGIGSIKFVFEGWEIIDARDEGELYIFAAGKCVGENVFLLRWRLGNVSNWDLFAL